MTGTARKAPGIPAEAIDYLRVSLELTPNEYRETSRDYYETALVYQDARRRGIEDARADHKARKQGESEEQAAIAALKQGG